MCNLKDTKKSFMAYMITFNNFPCCYLKIKRELYIFAMSGEHWVDWLSSFQCLILLEHTAFSFVNNYSEERERKEQIMTCTVEPAK